jgi:diguanylate cyclase (GGDEF)-like protein
MQNTKLINTISEKIEKLPTLPGIAIKLIEAVGKNEPDINEISRIISTDAALATKIIKLVNSSFYGFASKITTVEHAIKMLGLNTVKSLALSFSLMTEFSGAKAKGINYSKFWKDSLVGAISAKLLAEKVQRSFSADAFFMGLLQNIGSLLLAFNLPDQYHLVISAAEKDGGGWHGAEDQIFGFNHMELGEYLANTWGMPEYFYIPIGYHHCPEKLASIKSADIQLRSKLLHLSALYIDLFNTAEVSLALGSIQNLTKKYGFENYVDCADLAENIQIQTREILPIFDIRFKDERDYSKLLEKAKAEFANLSMDLINSLLEKNKENELLRQQITIDAMTQLNNYKGFCEILNSEISRASRYKKPLSLIFADIDHFKSVNDNYGHQAGDHALKIVAGSLKNELRDSDNIARYGGEEFVIILPETNTDDALRVSERLREKIKSIKMSYNGNSINVTMSFGVATLPNSQRVSSDKFIKMADEALYRAKGQGRDRSCVFGID